MASRGWVTRLWIALAAGGLGALGAVAIGSSCTIFSGVTFEESTDAGNDGDASGTGVFEHYLSMEDGARLCSKLVTCPENAFEQQITVGISVPMDAANFSVCMSWLAGRIPKSRIGIPQQRATLKCMADADSCVAAGACLPDEYLDVSDPRCLDPKGQVDGGICEDAGASVLRCEYLDELHCENPQFGPAAHCLHGGDGYYWCALSPTCNESPSCNGTFLSYCGSTSKLKHSFDCAAIGDTCGINPSTQLYDCLTDGRLQLCQTVGASCDKDRVEVCDYDTLSLFDCAELGGTCDAEPSHFPLCIRSDDACSAFDPDVNVCSGSKLALCVGGQRTDFDCKTIGKACSQTMGAPAACK